MDFLRWITSTTNKRTQLGGEKAKTVTSGGPSVNSVLEDLEMAWKKQILLTFEDFASKVAIIRTQHRWNSLQGLLGTGFIARGRSSN